MAKKVSTRKINLSAKKTATTKSKTNSKLKAKAASEKKGLREKLTMTAKRKTSSNLSAKKSTIQKPTKTSLKVKPKAKTKIESTLESPREPSRELEGSGLTPQSKMKLPRKNERDFREAQRTQAQPNSVNPVGRR